MQSSQNPPIDNAVASRLRGLAYRGTRGFGQRQLTSFTNRRKDQLSMKNSIRFIVLSLFVLCVSLSAFAQSSTTGSIEGTVVDQAGAAVPGATVNVSGSNLISAQSATTDDSGHFRFL